MDDLISRQEAIQAVGLTTWAGARISKLPSTQPEKKKGKWIKLDADTFHCRLCGHIFMLMQGECFMNYCPNCGADMREETDNA